MPTPATATPAGRSHIAPRRSDQRPKSGWIRDDDACDARITAPTARYDSANRSRRNGSRAGSAPLAKSVAKCPLDSSAIARRSMFGRTELRLATGLAAWPLGLRPPRLARDEAHEHRERGRTL